LGVKERSSFFHPELDGAEPPERGAGPPGRSPVRGSPNRPGASTPVEAPAPPSVDHPPDERRDRDRDREETEKRPRQRPRRDREETEKRPRRDREETETVS